MNRPRPPLKNARSALMLGSITCLICAALADEQGQGERDIFAAVVGMCLVDLVLPPRRSALYELPSRNPFLKVLSTAADTAGRVSAARASSKYRKIRNCRAAPTRYENDRVASQPFDLHTLTAR